MQIFLPYADYEETGWSLYPGHPGHLGNQFYREGKIVLFSRGWNHHPIHRMWEPYKYSLCNYLIILYHILKERNIGDYKVHYKEIKSFQKTLNNTGKPHWLGNKDFHASHRSNLLRKDKEKGWNWYCQFGWKEPDNLEYVWPI